MNISGTFMLPVEVEILSELLIEDVMKSVRCERKVYGTLFYCSFNWALGEK